MTWMPWTARQLCIIGYCPVCGRRFQSRYWYAGSSVFTHARRTCVTPMYDEDYR